MSDDLGELRRRAYGRPLSDVDAREAQAELQLLTRAPDAPAFAPVLPPAVASVPRRHLLLLAAATTVAAALAIGMGVAPRPSLDVFTSPQSGVPSWPGAPVGDDDIRWLGSVGGWDVFGLITTGGNVCVTAFLGGASGGGSCTSHGGFVRNGLALATGSLTVSWGPIGGAHLDDSRR